MTPSMVPARKMPFRPSVKIYLPSVLLKTFPFRSQWHAGRATKSSNKKLTRETTANQSSILRPAFVTFRALKRRITAVITSMLKITAIMIRPTRSLTSAKALFSTGIATCSGAIRPLNARNSRSEETQMFDAVGAVDEAVNRGYSIG
ncbi:hypothetical protein RRF57_011697 [Xylaria bambusicola]|uniref:Uncharacterized protein n=1 Tax=Xylaria bambusicola TaxID=326684 RepID=A0AAN7V0X3_9PEZI